MKKQNNYNEFIAALEQQKNEQRAIFCSLLNNIASIIRRNDLTATECADLLDQECELIQAQHWGGY